MNQELEPVPSSEVNQEQTLARGLKNRHVQLIAIGGAIGTGLFLGSGHSIALAGPAILFAYIITGGICFLMMRALGELLLSNTKYHTFIEFVQDYMGEKTAFVTGWTYWFCWISVAMADITAVGIYVKYWFPSIEAWIPSLVTLFLLLLMNLLTVKLFGELEFWFACIKVAAIVALIVLGIYFIMTGQPTSVGIASFSNLWSHGGWFPKGLDGFIQSFQMVVFAFAGIELVGLTAGETENPKKVIPQSINSIPIRIILFYVGALGVIMSIFPWDSVNPDRSPFVEVFLAVGIVGAASLVNFVVLTSAASACNSGVFSTSRLLYSLAKRSHAPGILEILTNKQVPANALFLSVLVICLVVALQYVIAEGVFVIITSVATFCFLYIWGIITICHMKYIKARPDLAAKSTFKMPLFPILNYVVLAFFAFVIVTLAFNPATRVALFVTPIWFILLLLIYQLKKEIA
ncbi:amino acid permease [Veillonella criceti]|uniref:D-serine/D-alanine/glycine transporter n=1 Tax=Veillonella criceti TaxID=103891 RepID=A0A380NIP8_9FIRM|nr:amino acid permease [Veillonella criceti]SUP42029.1 D-serine/D-alanine/glycine transporter [Veillonella criceti]